MVKVLVTGSDGQLGSEIQVLESQFETIAFTVLNSNNFDITNKELVARVFNKNNYDYCINCAGYTAVDKAEEEKVKAYNVNVDGVINLTNNCLLHHVKLIQISTDYVFDGLSNIPYKEEDTTNPINYYGLTKLKGEETIREKLTEFFIIRTSWLYGKKGSNFVNTMLDLAQTKKEIKVVNDQIGSPTNATDLAHFIVYLITSNNTNFGVYHFSNQGQTSWYGFVKEIYKQLDIKTKLTPINSNEYPTKAKRPFFSVLNTDKVINKTGFAIKNWKTALNEYL